MSLRETRWPRLQDLSREQAFGHEARMILRATPLLIVRSDCPAKIASTYFSELFNLQRLLCEVALGNVSLEAAQEKARTYDALLDRAEYFDKKSAGLVYAVRLATDALGGIDSVRYNISSASEHDSRNPDAQAILANSAHMISTFGMVGDTLVEPAELDFRYIIDSRDGTEQITRPQFFARRLWPDNHVFSITREGMLPGVEVLLDAWIARLHELRLYEVVTAYDSLLAGINLLQKKPPLTKAAHVVHNSVTINLGEGASFTGPVTVAETIKDALIAVGHGETQLATRLREAVQNVSQMIEALPRPEEKVEVSEQLRTFVEEARTDKPNKNKLESAAGGILSRAVAAAKFITPIAESIAAVLKLVAGN